MLVYQRVHLSNTVFHTQTHTHTPLSRTALSHATLSRTWLSHTPLAHNRSFSLFFPRFPPHLTQNGRKQKEAIYPSTDPIFQYIQKNELNP